MALPTAAGILRRTALHSGRPVRPQASVAVQPVAPAQSQLPDWQADPVLQRIEAQNQATQAQAQAAAADARRQAEINYGYDPNLTYEDQNTRQAAQQNPFSTLSQLLQGHQRQNTVIDEGTNKQNLYYSSTRAKDLGNEAQNYLQQQYSAGQGLKGQLSGIAGNLLTAQTGGANAVSQAQSDAYNRGLNFQLQYGGYPETPQVPAAQTQPQRATIGPPRGLPRPRAAHILARQLPAMYSK